MNAGIKTAAKKAVQGKTGKLFLVSLFALFLRLLLVSICVFTVYALSAKTVQSYINSFCPNLFAAYMIYLAFAVLLLLAIQTAAAIRLGEIEYYGILAGGGIAGFSVLFAHCSPFRALKALTLYVTVSVFKLLWLFVMLLPSAGIAAAAFGLYYGGPVSVKVFLVLCVAAVLLLCAGLICWYLYVQKYCFAALFCAKNKSFSPHSAIRRSIAVFDRSALNPALLKISLFIPLIMCVLIFPAVYIFPYIRMNMASLYTESKKNAKLITRPAEKKPVVLHTKKSYNW